MKRIICATLVVIFMFTFFGCKQQKAEEFAASDTVIENKTEEPVEEEQPVEVPLETPEAEPEEEESVPEQEAEEEPAPEGLTIKPAIPPFVRETTTYPFEYEDCLDLKLVDLDDFSYAVFHVYPTPHDYTSAKRYIDDSVIIVGRAFGSRTAEVETNFGGITKTQVKVEKVLKGTFDRETFVLIETYFPFLGEGNEYVKEPCLVAPKDSYSRLVNGELVLLFLTSKVGEDGSYEQAYFSFPLAEDYDCYSEEAMTRLLDYYRGDPSAYKADYEQRYRWPFTEKSDAQMLEELKDNVLVQISKDLEILIWPEGHVNYQPTSMQPDALNGLHHASRPRS